MGISARQISASERGYALGSKRNQENKVTIPFHPCANRLRTGTSTYKWSTGSGSNDPTAQVPSRFFLNQPHDPRNQTRTQARARSRTQIHTTRRTVTATNTTTYTNCPRHPHSSRLSFQLPVSFYSTSLTMQPLVRASSRSGSPSRSSESCAPPGIKLVLVLALSRRALHSFAS